MPYYVLAAGTATMLFSQLPSARFEENFMLVMVNVQVLKHRFVDVVIPWGKHLGQNQVCQLNFSHHLPNSGLVIQHGVKTDISSKYIEKVLHMSPRLFLRHLLVKKQ